MHNFSYQVGVNPGLVGCQMAVEPGVKPLFRKIFREVSKEVGLLSFDDEAHRGIWLEYLLADYQASFEPAVVQFPGRWALESPVQTRCRVRPGLCPLKMAYEPGVQPLLERVSRRVGLGLGITLSTKNPVHLGVMVEVLCLTYYLEPLGYRLCPVGGSQIAMAG